MLLLPARSQNRLDLLWSLIDRLVPAQTGLLAEGCHRLDQLIHLCIQQHLAVTSLERFDLIAQAEVPVLHGNLIARPMNGHAQVVGMPAEHQVKRIDAGIVEEFAAVPLLSLMRSYPSPRPTR